MVDERKIKARKWNDIFTMLMGISILILLNVIGAFFFSRIDLTEDNRYSLSKTTIEQSSQLEDIVFVRVYLEGDLSADYKRLRDAAKELLDEYRAYSGNMLQYEFIDPSDNPNAKEREKVYKKLVREGIQPTTLTEQSLETSSEKVIFPGAIISYGSKNAAWQILKTQMGVPEPAMINNSIQQQEYELASIIRTLTTPNKSRIAIIQGHGEYDKTHLADITNVLNEQYVTEFVEINEQLTALRTFNLAIIAGPDSAFTEKDKFIIDQFIMKGGKAIWFYEPVAISLDSLQTVPTTMALPRDLNIDDLLFKYGVRFNRNLIMDLQCLPLPIVTGQVGNTPRQELKPWYYFPLVVPTSNHPIVKNLDGIKTEFVSNIDFVGKKDTAIKKTKLLTSSEYTKLVRTPNRVSFNILREVPDKRQYSMGPEALAVLVEGVFQSNFKNRITDQIKSEKSIAFRESSYPTAQIFIADGDIIKNRVNLKTNQYFSLGHDKYTRRIYANKDFVMNCVNYLLDDSGLLELRSKEFKMRLLDRPKVEKEKTKWQFINVVFPVMIILLFGSFSFYYRKKKYASKK